MVRHANLDERTRTAPVQRLLSWWYSLLARQYIIGAHSACSGHSRYYFDQKLRYEICGGYAGRVVYCLYCGNRRYI